MNDLVQTNKRLALKIPAGEIKKKKENKKNEEISVEGTEK